MKSISKLNCSVTVSEWEYDVKTIPLLEINIMSWSLWPTVAVLVGLVL